jgi:hypothetical protein
VTGSNPYSGSYVRPSVKVKRSTALATPFLRGYQSTRRRPQDGQQHDARLWRPSANLQLVICICYSFENVPTRIRKTVKYQVPSNLLVKRLLSFCSRY